MQSKTPVATASGTDTVSPLAALQSCFAGALLIADRNGRLVRCTPAAETALHIKRRTAQLPACIRPIARECLESGQAVLTQIVSPSKNSKATLSVSAIPVRRGRFMEVVIVLHEIAPLHQLEVNLRRLDRLATV